MEHKSGLIEQARVACLMLAAMATFTFMVSYACCMSLARK